MQLHQEQLRALMGRLSGARVAHRSQGGAQLSYVEAYDIRATLIRIFGFGGFDVDVIESSVLNQDLRQREGTQKPIWDIAVRSTVRLYIHPSDGFAPGASYTESAVSQQSNPDFGEAADFATKTATSDALKRCAINLGTQFGLGLYDNGSLNEIVRILFEPEQARMWEAVKGQTPVTTPEQAAALAQSVGVENGAQAAAQPQEPVSEVTDDPAGDAGVSAHDAGSQR